MCGLAGSFFSSFLYTVISNQFDFEMDLRRGSSNGIEANFASTGYCILMYFRLFCKNPLHMIKIVFAPMPGLVFLLLCAKVATEGPIAFKVSREKVSRWQICILNEVAFFCELLEE